MKYIYIYDFDKNARLGFYNRLSKQVPNLIVWKVIYKKCQLVNSHIQ